MLYRSIFECLQFQVKAKKLNEKRSACGTTSFSAHNQQLSNLWHLSNWNDVYNIEPYYCCYEFYYMHAYKSTQNTLEIFRKNSIECTTASRVMNSLRWCAFSWAFYFDIFLVSFFFFPFASTYTKDKHRLSLHLPFFKRNITDAHFISSNVAFAM